MFPLLVPFCWWTHSSIGWVDAGLGVGRAAAITHCVRETSDGLRQAAATITCTLSVGGSRADLIPNPTFTYSYVTFTCWTIEPLVSLDRERESKRAKSHPNIETVEVALKVMVH